MADTSKLSVPSRRDSQDFSSGTPDQSAVRTQHNSSAPRSRLKRPENKWPLQFQPSPAELEGVGGGSSCPEGPGAAEVVRPPVSGPWDYTLLSGISSSVKRVPSLLTNNEDELPPLLIITGEDEAGGRCCEQEVMAVCVRVQHDHLRVHSRCAGGGKSRSLSDFAFISRGRTPTSDLRPECQPAC